MSPNSDKIMVPHFDFTCLVTDEFLKQTLAAVVKIFIYRLFINTRIT